MIKRLHKRLRPQGQSGGFVLAELIVAIALLAMVSGIVLQLFLVASTSNRNARDIDRASSQAVSVMERLRSLQPSQYAEDSLFGSAHIQDDGESIVLSLYYDNEWNEISQPLEREGFVLTAVVTPGQVQTELGERFSSRSNLSGGDPMRAGMIDIAIEVSAGRYNSETDEVYSETLISFESAKYTTKEAA